MSNFLDEVEFESARLESRLMKAALRASLSTDADSPEYEDLLRAYERQGLLTTDCLSRVLDHSNASGEAAQRIAYFLLREIARVRLAEVNRAVRESRYVATHDVGDRSATIPELLAGISSAVTSDEKSVALEHLCRASDSFWRLASVRAEVVDQIARETGHGSFVALVDAVTPRGDLSAEATALASAETGSTLDAAVDAERAICRDPRFDTGSIFRVLTEIASRRFPQHRRIKVRSGWQPSSHVYWPADGGHPAVVFVLPTRRKGLSSVVQWALAFHELGHALHFTAPDMTPAILRRALLDTSLSEAFACLFETIFAEGADLLGLESVRPDVFKDVARVRVLNLQIFAGPVPYLLDRALVLGGSKASIEKLFETYVHRHGSEMWRGAEACGRACWYRSSEVPMFAPSEYIRAQAGRKLFESLQRRFGDQWVSSPTSHAWPAISSLASRSTSVDDFAIY